MGTKKRTSIITSDTKERLGITKKEVNISDQQTYGVVKQLSKGSTISGNKVKKDESDIDNYSIIPGYVKDMVVEMIYQAAILQRNLTENDKKLISLALGCVFRDKTGCCNPVVNVNAYYKNEILMSYEVDQYTGFVNETNSNIVDAYEALLAAKNPQIDLSELELCIKRYRADSFRKQNIISAVKSKIYALPIEITFDIKDELIKRVEEIKQEANENQTKAFEIAVKKLKTKEDEKIRKSIQNSKVLERAIAEKQILDIKYPLISNVEQMELRSVQPTFAIESQEEKIKKIQESNLVNALGIMEKIVAFCDENNTSLKSEEQKEMYEYIISCKKIVDENDILLSLNLKRGMEKISTNDDFLEDIKETVDNYKRK